MPIDILPVPNDEAARHRIEEVIQAQARKGGSPPFKAELSDIQIPRPAILVGLSRLRFFVLARHVVQELTWMTCYECRL
jgi:hypothetical protein